ncbi:hypothetical protein UFOVP797_9 [uncultured Caudovirales phage]|uniref:Uncharacterized protein n=1 Tax=uncultured Caudovirales phage TaxID=2100421 RepID=A0A6J5NVL0_9CAUD|nr:hypothetical protein UFOVP797_9 [uncultured Caudovirales phage]
MTHNDITKAITQLAPNAEFVLYGDDLTGLEWLSADIARPTDKAILAQVPMVQAAEAAEAARVLTPAEKLFNATGLTVAEYKALGL